jgi:biopolymer transport protein ExbD
MRIDLGHDEPPEIGLIALIDCIFFLLMFFMLATTFQHDETHKPEKQLPVLLPAAQASLEVAGAAAAPLVLSVDRQGRFYVNGDTVTVQGLHDVLKREAARDPRRQVRIEGDEQVPYQHIVHVLDLCQFEGLTNIGLQTRQ